jgi:hypothetical protein
VPTISVWDFQRPIGIVALVSLSHMLRNLGRALLSVFSSVSVEIALWRRVFLGLDGFSCQIVFFQESVLRNTLLSVNVYVFLELVGLVSFTDRVRCSDSNLAISMSYLMRFPRRNQPILTEWQIGASVSFNPWVFMYAVTSSINMNESAVNMHGICNTVLIHS